MVSANKTPKRESSSLRTKQWSSKKHASSNAVNLSKLNVDVSNREFGGLRGMQDGMVCFQDRGGSGSLDAVDSMWATIEIICTSLGVTQYWSVENIMLDAIESDWEHLPWSRELFFGDCGIGGRLCSCAVDLERIACQREKLETMLCRVRKDVEQGRVGGDGGGGVGYFSSLIQQ
eukprot:1401066-Rhodomonas_salina.1